MIIDGKEIHTRVMHSKSEYEEFEKFMTLNAELIGICQEMRNLYTENFLFILYRVEEKPDTEARRQYFRQLVLKKVAIEEEMRNLIKKFGVFSKVIDGKRIFTDGRDD